MAAPVECDMDFLNLKYKIKVKNLIGLLIFFLVAIDLKAASCESTKEFISSLEYLRRQKNFTLPESENFKAALAVSKNCTGASARFQKMLNTLVSTGVDHDHALKFSIQYSQEDNESVEAFLSLYEGLVLEKKFNLPFYQAFETAKFFAESTKGNKAELKKDFIGFLSFCFEDLDGTLLSLDQCRKLSFQYLNLHKYYPQGVFKDFKNLFVFLRDKRETGLPISTALSITHEVLLNGPGAQKNFIDSYQYGLNQLSLKPSQALALSLKLATYTVERNEK